MRRLTVLTVTAGLLAVGVLGAASAQAQTVDHYFGPFEAHFVDSFDCGFPIQWDISGQFHEDDFYDSSGTLTKSITTQGHGAVQITATANGVTLGGTAPQNYVYIATYNPDGSIIVQSFIGIFLQITVPGEGTVFAQVGRLVIDGEGNGVFQAGPNQDLGHDTEDFCAAFG